MPISTRLFSAWSLLLITALAAHAETLDNFEDAGTWQVIASDGVEASLEMAPGFRGRAARLSYDFRGNAGFFLVRKTVDLALPENYVFGMHVRGGGTANNLEFKLVDDSGDNVWWFVRRAFSPPSEWTELRTRARHIHFAWGPAGGGEIRHVAAIEIAFAAHDGGKGELWLDELTFEALPPVSAEALPMIARSESGAFGGQPDATQLTVPANGVLDWRSHGEESTAALALDFQQYRALGGIVVDWGAAGRPARYRIDVSTDGDDWATIAEISEADGERDYVPLRDAEGRALRLVVTPTSPAAVAAIDAIRILPVAVADSLNALFATIAKDAPRGRYPRYCLGEMDAWTVVGVAGDEKEALFSATGAIEIDKGAFRLEPFLLVDGRLVTWASADAECSLEADYLPIPSVTWNTAPIRLEITAVGHGAAGASSLAMRYVVTNVADEPKSGRLAVAVRPFQVLPPWHDLNMTGGVASIETIAGDTTGATVNGDVAIRPWSAASEFGATTFLKGEIVEHLARGAAPKHNTARDPRGLASAALVFDYALAPGEGTSFVVEAPWHGDRSSAAPDGLAPADVAPRYAALLSNVARQWRAELNRVELTLPPPAKHLVDTFKSMQAYILINADGPAIQPGSRTYERSWIRDGAMTSSALLYTAHAAQVRKFIEWYAPYQYADGKIPCIVDSRGADAFPEHDSTGQFIHLLYRYFQFTGDKGLLSEQYSRVPRAVAFLDSLRRQRMTEAYQRDGTLERACLGLVPESASHEGYAAKFQHSYWDSFFTIRGLRDAAEIARILDHADDARRFEAFLKEYRQATYDSIALAIKWHKIDFIPGCVELGDFDATSTAIAVSPCGELRRAPQPALSSTFDRYLKWFRERRDDVIVWREFTPYEVRIVETFIRLGRPAVAHELLEFFFAHQNPQGWNQWGEIAYRNPLEPRFVGDMPHTWVGSAYVSAVRSMLVYENEDIDGLILAAGVPADWLRAEGGVSISHFPTAYGTLSYQLSAGNRQIQLKLTLDGTPPPGGCLLRLPEGWRPTSVEFSEAAVEPTFDENGVRIVGAGSFSLRIGYAPR